MRRLLGSLLLLSVAACAEPQKPYDDMIVDDGLAGLDKQCQINSNGASWSGPCKVVSDDESVGIELPENARNFEVIVSLGLFEFEPGQWEVRGLTTDGINSRWGTASLTSGENSCWSGSDFKICISDFPVKQDQ